jgi:hypothetical protein
MSSKEFKPKISEDMKAQNSFHVPDGYFETFPERLNKRIKESNNYVPVRSFFPDITMPKLAIAASFIGFMLVVFGGIKYSMNQHDYKGSFQPSIVNLADYPIYDLDETMIYDLYSENNSQENLAATDKKVTDEMINYLILEDADIELLIQDL